MSHFSILVIGDDVAAAMAPYQENNMGGTEEKYLHYEPIDLTEYTYKTHQEAIDDGYTEKDGKACSVYNPNSFFDYYSENGRYQRTILNKAGNLVNSAMKADIDFDGMYAEAIAKATERYDMAMAIFGELPPHKTLNEITKRMQSTDEVYPTTQTRQTARKIWKNQPRVVAFDTAVEGGVIEKYKLFPDDYAKTKEEYIKECVALRFTTFGFVVSEPEDEANNTYESRDYHDTEEYQRLFQEAIDNAEDDDWLTILDCHV